MAVIQSGLESYHAKVATLADGQKEPHLHINLPDLTGLEDKYQNILRHISKINSEKASKEDIWNMCNKVLDYIKDETTNPLLNEIRQLQKTVVSYHERMEGEVLKNGELKIISSLMSMVILAAFFLFILQPPTSRADRRNAEKYQIMRSVNRETDTMYYYLDRIYSQPRDRKAIRAQRDSMAVRNARLTTKVYKTE